MECFERQLPKCRDILYSVASGVKWKGAASEPAELPGTEPAEEPATTPAEPADKEPAAKEPAETEPATEKEPEPKG
jgi:hypothetical protein